MFADVTVGTTLIASCPDTLRSSRINGFHLHIGTHSLLSRKIAITTCWQGYYLVSELLPDGRTIDQTDHLKDGALHRLVPAYWIPVI